MINMKHNYCAEDVRNLILLEIKNRKAALELYPKVIEVVQKYDGKVLNKRFDTALKKADGRLSYDRDTVRFTINMSCFDNRFCKSVKVDKAALKILPIFKYIAKVGNIPERDMFNTFNMGVGMSVVVAKEDVDRALQILRANGDDAYVIGEIIASEDKVILC